MAPVIEIDHLVPQTTTDKIHGVVWEKTTKAKIIGNVQVFFPEGDGRTVEIVTEGKVSNPLKKVGTSPCTSVTVTPDKHGVVRDQKNKKVEKPLTKTGFFWVRVIHDPLD